MSKTNTTKKPTKKQTTVNINTDIIKDFKSNPLSLSAFINLYGRKYLNGEL